MSTVERVEFLKELPDIELHAVPPVQVLSDFHRDVMHRFKGESISFSLDNELTRNAGLFTAQYDANVYQILLTAFKILLFRYSNQEDISVATFCSISAENNNGGLPVFAARIPTLHSKMNGNTSFRAFLQIIKATTGIPQESQKTDSQSPLQGMFIFLDEKGVSSFEPNAVQLFQDTLSKSDFIMIMADTLTGIHGTISFRPNVYHKKKIERMIIHYDELLNSIAEDPGQKIGALKMLTREEEHRLLFNFNNTLEEYPRKTNLVDLFQEQVLRTPGHIALQLGAETMNYDQLNVQSNRLAGYMIDRGLKNGDNVGLIMTRGFDMIIGMYAILKAGGAYVPVDPDYPLDLQEYILKQSAVKLVLAGDDYPVKELSAPESYINIKSIERIETLRCENPEIKRDSRQLAYTLYTSGSTGRPKGVMIEHHSVVNLLDGLNKKYPLGTEDRLLFVTSMCFDLSVYDIFGILSTGGKLVIARKQDTRDMEKLQSILLDYKITFWNSVPTIMDFLIKDLEGSNKSYRQYSLRTVFLSGDWIPVDLPDRIMAYFPNAEVISLGGSTEGTVWTGVYPVKKSKSHCISIPYGKPLQNNFFYILNDQLQPVPPGETGEIYIGGVGVARGYANDQEKTDAAFIGDPFISEGGGRMYRSGDLGRMLPDMNIELLGRKDHQVKIRGHRVELGEIENVLKQSGLIKAVVVMAKDDSTGQKKLVGYIVASGTFRRETAIRYLKTKLPEHMIPAVWLQLGSLPLTSNGKINRKALLELETPVQVNDGYAAPTSDLEKVFVKIWQEVFDLVRVGIRDNFFELGGDSLIAIHAISKILTETGIKLSFSIFFDNPTVQQQVSYIHKSKINWNGDAAAKSMNCPSLVPLKQRGSLPPLYLVHGLALNVMAFKELSMLFDVEQPLFGLQAIGIPSAKTYSMTIEKLAAFYLEEILQHNPDGPYYIGGYSFGAFVAYEMGKQLQALGKNLVFLSIIDSDTNETESTSDYLKIIPLPVLKQLMGLKYKTGVLVKAPFHAIRNFYTGNKKEVIKSWYDFLPVYTQKMVDNFSIAMRKYKLQPYDVHIELYHSEETNPDSSVRKQQKFGWDKYASQVRLHAVPGDHLSLLKNPNVSILATHIQNSLKQANRSAADMKKKV